MFNFNLKNSNIWSHFFKNGALRKEDLILGSNSRFWNNLYLSYMIRNFVLSDRDDS